MKKNISTPITRAKRRFCVLDRAASLVLAVKAIAELRAVAESKDANESIGLTAALQALEQALNCILQYSYSKFSEELFYGVVVDPLPIDVEKVRMRAASSVKSVRKVLKDARGDLSVDEVDCTRLDANIGFIEERLNDLLPPQGAPKGACLPF